MDIGDIAVLISAAIFLIGVVWFFVVSAQSSYFRIFGITMIMFAQTGLVHGIVNENSIPLGVAFAVLVAVGMLPFMLIVELAYGSKRRVREGGVRDN